MVYNSLAILAIIVGGVVGSQARRIKELEERLGITTQAGQTVEQAGRQARESLIGGLPALLGLLAGWLLIGGEWGLLAGALAGVLVGIVASAAVYVRQSKNSNGQFSGIDKGRAV